MKLFFSLLLLFCAPALRAQERPPLLPYTDVASRYQLAYPPGWQLLQEADTAPDPTFAPAGPQAAAAVAVVATPLPAGSQSRAARAAGQDSLWLRRIRRLPEAEVQQLSQRGFGTFSELRYEYYYGSAAAGRTHVAGRLLRRGSAGFRVEYRAPASQDARYLAEGRQLVESFAFTTTPGAPAAAAPSSGTAAGEPGCDNKLYGIAAYRLRDGVWEDDCRTIHEFSLSDPTARPRVHRRVLPFQSYALAKGFDNCLYSVPSAPTGMPEYVYRYNPATRKGSYTTWQLPAQGYETGWISASTDAQGNLYFLTGDANLLVRVNPTDGQVKTIWTSDPTQTAAYYPAIGFVGAGTHGNFCLDESGTVFMVYSTDGALLRVNLKTRTPHPDLLPIDNLPQRGGYSDVLLQHDAAGRRSLYLAGPKALYKVDPVRRQARLLRRGTYTDLAGCNLFRTPPPTAPVAATGPTAWQGRVLDAGTGKPLPRARLRIGPAGAEAAVPLTPEAGFSYPATPGSRYAYHAQLAGYLATDSSLTAGPGPLTRDILLRPLIVGATLPLRNVQFQQGDAVLLSSSFPALDKLVGLLNDNPRLTIELRGHTDNVGPPAKNVLLSEERVAAVKAYLVRRGIDEARITGRGLGGTQPTASNEHERTRRLNRRVEFRVTGLR